MDSGRSIFMYGKGIMSFFSCKKLFELCLSCQMPHGTSLTLKSADDILTRNHSVYQRGEDCRSGFEFRCFAYRALHLK